MKRICFVTHEIAPTTWGGCGVLLFNAARILLQQGNEVIFVLDLPKDYFHQFQYFDRPRLLHPEKCRAYHVESILATEEENIEQDHFVDPAAWRSYRIHLACRYVAQIEQPDIIEFHDFLGVGHYALASKVAGLCYRDQHLVVRLHTSVEVMDIKGSSAPVDAHSHIVHDLERSALQMAETIVYPSLLYLSEAYRPFYPSWFGNVVESQPPIVDIPVLRNCAASPNIILFYGRIFSLKGVDIFVDAAVEFLRQHENVRFVLAGYDSRQAPDGSLTYEQFLRRKIPSAFQPNFEFVGQIDRNQLESLLPNVRFAVFPNHYESFCYAAHEIYAAGVPIIVSNIPAFRDFFKHEENALIFDGTVDDLVKQMTRLWRDEVLRRRLMFPYPVATRPLGDVYANPPRNSWIVADTQASCSLLICIVGEADDRLQETIKSVRRAQKRDMRIVHLQPADTNNDVASGWLLGQLFRFRSPEGDALLPTSVLTEQALLLLRAGDRIAPDFVHIACNTLARQPQIGFVGAWHRVYSSGRARLENFPFDASVELLPFVSGMMLHRFVMRTPAHRMLIDVLDQKTGSCGEIAYVWRLDAEGRRGLIIPKPLLERDEEPRFAPRLAYLSALILRDSSCWHQSRLARLLIWYAEYARAGKLPGSAIGEPSSVAQSRLWRLVRKVYALPGYPLMRSAALAGYRVWRKVTACD